MKTRMFRPMLVIGTRPEAVKMAPVYWECLRRGRGIRPVVCFTGQHREMLGQAACYLGLRPDVRLSLMRPGQGLAGLTGRAVTAMDSVLRRLRPDCVVAQGDTTTVLATALAAFYRRVPLVHVEAGLRTGSLEAPWPEELNRRVADMAAVLHCAPTPRAAAALVQEGARPETVHVTGNTVVDALLATLRRERAGGRRWRRRFSFLGDRPMVLITGHRRENFGTGLENICLAVSGLAALFRDHHFIYPVHLNPHVQRPVRRALGRLTNVHLCPPVDYPGFVWLMDRCKLILTDSGGVQEEAPTLRKPVLVMREATERPEAVDAGSARLVGTSVESIMDGTVRLLTDRQEYESCRARRNPYGDGRAARRIVGLMLRQGWAAGGPSGERP